MHTRSTLLSMYPGCSALLPPTVRDITEEQLFWKPAEKSRSIAEIMRHLIRVDLFFLKQLCVEHPIADPGAQATSNALIETHNAIAGLFETYIDEHNDESLRTPFTIDDGKTDTAWRIISHAAQHYLYHASQMIYLRRAQDRNWISPIADWETLVDRISGFALDREA